MKTVYDKDKAKQAKVPYFHYGPFLKKARLEVGKKYIRSNSKGKVFKNKKVT